MDEHQTHADGLVDRAERWGLAGASGPAGSDADTPRLPSDEVVASARFLAVTATDVLELPAGGGPPVLHHDGRAIAYGDGGHNYTSREARRRAASGEWPVVDGPAEGLTAGGAEGAEGAEAGFVNHEATKGTKERDADE